MTHARLATAIVGAGPAGLLFAVVGRMLLERRQQDPGAWAMRVYDKRESYARTHRLRMDPAPYLEIQRAVTDARFDALIDFLTEQEFTPEVNELEARLAGLLAAVGVRKELLAIGDGEGETSLLGLRQRLEGEGIVGPETLFTIVAADSVHSAVRDLVRGEIKPERQTHERIARIRIVGPNLPRRVGAVEQVRLSKVLGSVLDYRLNRNGFAEMDLFLTPAEHAIVGALGASPRAPVPLSAGALSKLRAPLFRAIVSHVERGSDATPREVLLQSTFQLEHALMPRLTFTRPEIGGHVFLVGDAGVSLPFQRGMACLAHCAHSLARIHCDLLSVAGEEQRALTVARYDLEADAHKRRELRVVRSRAQLVGTLREIVRVSAMLPFPIQSWWLRAAERERSADRFSLWFFLNAAAAIAALALAIGGSWLAARGFGVAGWLAWLALPVELVGGVVYHCALAFEGGAHRLVRRVWEVQIAMAFFAGVAVTVWSSSSTGRLTSPVAALWWLILAAAFIVGLFAFERVVSRWFERAGIRFEDAADPAAKQG